MSAILQFFPERLDVNGDAQNAMVLAQRARWAGIDVQLHAVATGERTPTGRPAAVIVGSSVDSELRELRADLADYASVLADWVADGVPVLAIGTGFELLSLGIQLGTVDLPTEYIEGFGIFAGRAQPLPARAIGDLVVDAREQRLVGFENHSRGFVAGAAAPALGSIARGIGNDGKSEGARAGSAIGTHLHGPVLAKNPVLADEMLTAAFGDAYRANSKDAARVDGYAAAARALIIARLDL